MLKAATRTAAALFGLLALGCGPEFDRPSELEGLRVLAVQKDLPYAKPGDTVTLKMLWHDERNRPVQRFWITGCFDPLADLYAGCIEQFASIPEQLANGASLTDFGGVGDTITLRIPDDIISRRPPPTDPTQPAYGIAYVFFMACAGTIDAAPPSKEPAFPFVCKDPSGKLLGTSDFVVGYTTIYAYATYQNQNPVIDGFRVKNTDVASSKICVGDACLAYQPATCDDPNVPGCETSPTAEQLFGDPPQPGEPPQLQCGNVPCVSPCADDGAESCPGIPIQPIINSSSEEHDQISSATRGRDYWEEQWIDYYVSRGKVKSDARLVTDAIQGPVSDYGTLFRAPKDSGPVDVFAVVHDNRGGVQWVRTVIVVE